MPRRPPEAIPPLSPVITLLPLSRRRRSSFASSVSSSPHTPPNSNSPLPLFSADSNRNSASSWNSSNHDGADDLEFEWSPEQVRLLSRTLDALPAHLLTPFNGPVPPSNLLDKIARGVSQAKGPINWPQSLRATRSKIVELARIRARDASNESSSDTITEEDDTDQDVLKQTTNTGPKRPLYRQFSMDFVQPSRVSLKDNHDIARLSNRLQHPEQHVSLDSSVDAHSPSRAISPLAEGSHGNRLDHSTPSSTTLNSGASDLARVPRLQKSLSSVSGSSDVHMAPAIDLRVQRIKRSESFGGHKRASSFGASSRRSSDAMSINPSGKDSDVTSSDEEEKLRTAKAKKARVQAASPTPASHAPSIVSLPEKKPRASRTHPHHISDKPSKVLKDSTRRSSRKADAQRNPTSLGPELPHPPFSPEYLAYQPSPCPSASKSRKSKAADSPTTTRRPGSPLRLVPATPATPAFPPSRSLKRTKGSRLPSRPLTRKISFGSIPAPANEENVGCGAGLGLGSAFQLR